MAGYFVANYTITNQAEYRQYLAAVGPILKAHGAENIVVDRDSEPLEGSAGQVTVVQRFATKATAKAPFSRPGSTASRRTRRNHKSSLRSASGTP